MKITRHDESDHTILLLEGRLDNSTAALLDDAFHGAFDTGARHFIWDCALLHYISSAGLRSVLQALKHLDQHEGRLILISLSPGVHEMFDISGFKALVTIAPDRPAALKLL